MEPKTIIERLNSEVLDYAKAGTHDRETLERFSREYMDLLDHKSLILCTTIQQLERESLGPNTSTITTTENVEAMAPGFSLLITELADDVFTETESGRTLWKVVLDCWTALGPQHDDPKPLAKTLRELIDYTFNESTNQVETQGVSQ